MRLRPLGHLSANLQSAQSAPTRVGLTRAVLALALRARCARPKSLQAILSNPRTPFRMLHTFQACAFDRSATSPRGRKGTGGHPRDQILAAPSRLRPYWAAPACSAADCRGRRPWDPAAAARDRTVGMTNAPWRIRRIEPRRHFQRWNLRSPLIFLRGMTIRTSFYRTCDSRS